MTPTRGEHGSDNSKVTNKSTSYWCSNRIRWHSIWGEAAKLRPGMRFNFRLYHFFRVSSNWICSGLWHLSPRKFHDAEPMIHKVYLTFSCHESTHNRLTKNLNSKTNIQQRYRDRHKKKMETNFNFSWSINTI